MNLAIVFSFILFASFIWSTFSETIIEGQKTSKQYNPLCSVGETCVLQNDQPICVSLCGDGIVMNNQACDDGDTDEENGCTNACQVSPYWVCIKQLEGNKYVSSCVYNAIEKCALYNITADNKIQCRTCEVGEEVSADGQKCLLKMPGCLKLNQQRSNYKTSFCSQCQTRYQLSDSTDKCLYKILGCVKLDQLKSTFMHTLCSQCQNGSMASSDRQKCYLTIPTCSVHDIDRSNYTNSYCTLCKSNHQISLLRDKCMPIIQGCLEYDQANSSSNKSQCVQCVNINILSDAKDKCIKKIEGCSHYQQFYSSFSQANCDSCSSQYKQQEDRNIYFVKINGCSMYDLFKSNGLNSICTSCKTGLLVSSQGNKCMKYIPGCMTYNQTSSTPLSSQCALCSQIFQISTNKEKCLLKIEGCSVYDEDNSNDTVSLCNQCSNPTQQPSQNKNKCILTIPSCIKYDQLKSNNISSVCSSCGDLILSINKDRCMFPIQECLIYDYQKSTPLTLLCQNCQVGFQISNDRTKCMKVVPGCVTYDQQISNPLESICVQCLMGFQLSSSKLKCMLLIPACLEYDELKSNYQSSECLTCSDANHLLTDLKDKCIIKIDACKTYDQTLSTSFVSMCEQCQQANQVVTLNRSKCILVTVQYCQFYNQQISTHEYSKCKLCHTGYLLFQNSSLCYPQIKKCIQYALALDACLRCQPGFFLEFKNQSCLSYSALGCSNNSNGTCSVNPGFVLDADMASYVYRDVQGCFRYDRYGMCTQCLPGYNTVQNANLSLSCSSPYAQFTRRQYYRSSGVKVLANWILNKNLSDTIYRNWRTPANSNNQIYELILDSLYNKVWPATGENYCAFIENRKSYCNSTYKLTNTKFQTYECSCSYRKPAAGYADCKKIIALSLNDYRFCTNTTNINGTTLCTQCEDGYKLYSGIILINKSCSPINDAYKFQVYTPLGIVRVLNSTTPVHNGWRVLATQQARLLKNNLNPRIEQYGTYMFNFGTHFYANNSYIMNNSISTNESDYYIIRMAPGEILNCQFYSPGENGLCFRCRDGYILSSDRLNCNPPNVSNCYVYHPLLLYCVATIKEIEDFKKNKEAAFKFSTFSWSKIYVSATLILFIYQRQIFIIYFY